MCVNQVTAFEHGGQLFHTERQALDAALKDIGKKLVADFHANPAEGMLQQRDAILRVLGRISEIEAEVALDRPSAVKEAT
ncbi:hypothetical protein [Sphingopyxis flava]|uniref:Uncharacterized protein n=1 Tax=Sphingopyxis flava TaxID=1507287 RepID=A0A1T4ZVR9_9SPHN|nr:hypothetical protein [Sphingopyxis flava]SKB26871.1 hypothetical protein SAMN06295937_1001247 [Sphingopyxis flava]